MQLHHHIHVLIATLNSYTVIVPDSTDYIKDRIAGAPIFYTRNVLLVCVVTRIPSYGKLHNTKYVPKQLVP